jgi:hypothetical protein
MEKVHKLNHSKKFSSVVKIIYLTFINIEYNYVIKFYSCKWQLNEDRIRCVYVI